MLPVYYLLIALLALPLAGTALVLAAPRFPLLLHHQLLIHVLAAGIMLVLSWLLRPSHVEVLVGSWLPVSFTGIPLILDTNRSGMVVLIALAAVMMADPVKQSQGMKPARAAAEALLFGALSMTVLANSMVTILVGLGLVDMLAVLNAALDAHSTGGSYDHVFRDALFLVGSLTFLIIGISLYDVSGSSLYLPLAHIPPQVMPFITISLVLRFYFLPLRGVADVRSESHWTLKASSLAGLAVMARLAQLGAPELRAWFFGLALITALAALVIGTLTTSRSTLRGSVNTGSLMLALTTAVVWQPATLILAATAWFLGTSLLEIRPEDQSASLKKVASSMSLLGALCLMGLPLTAGFVGRVGVASLWAGRGTNGTILLATWAIAQLLLTLCVLRLWQWQEVPHISGHTTSSLDLQLEIFLPLVAAGVLSLHVLIFGVAPNLAGASTFAEELSHMGTVGWLTWLIPTGLGATAWWLFSRWFRLLGRVRPAVLTAGAFGWWQDILLGALDRLAKPLRGIVIFLESDGALLWAVIVILIIVLVSRPGGP